ncbi:hypothetical protein ACJX0J_007341, partial [Zea mays]
MVLQFNNKPQHKNATNNNDSTHVTTLNRTNMSSVAVKCWSLYMTIDVLNTIGIEGTRIPDKVHVMVPIHSRFLLIEAQNYRQTKHEHVLLQREHDAHNNKEEIHRTTNIREQIMYCFEYGHE